MASAALFYGTVINAFTWTLLVIFLVIEVAAFINCLTQRADAFPVVGSLSKGAWLAILAGSVLLTLLCSRPGNIISIFGFAAITAASIYLLDVRPALRDAAEGAGPW